MIKRTLFVAIFAAVSLAGCGGSSQSSKTSNPQAAINTPPNVIIEETTAVEPGAQVTLEGVVTDAEDNVAALEWVQTAGSHVGFSGSDTDTISFTAPVSDKESTLTFTLTATDTEGESAVAEATVTVLSNSAPTVSINSIESVATQQSVTLTAVVSDDYSKTFTYDWEQLAPEEGYEVTLSQKDNEATFVSPVTKFNKKLKFRVTVTDQQNTSAQAETELEVTGDIHAQIRALTDAIVAEDFETVHADGFLLNDTATGAGLFKWLRTDTATTNDITAPIAHYLNAAGYGEIAATSFEEMYQHTNTDPTDPNNFGIADLGVFLYAYEVTGDQKYLDIANAMWDAVRAKYGYDGTNPPRTMPDYPLWGYDTYNQLMNAYMAVKHSLPNAETYYEDFSGRYEAKFLSHINETPSNAVYTNLIFDELGLGCRCDDERLTTNDPAADMQTVAFALISKTIDKEEAVDYLMDALSNKSGDDYSESVAEAIIALNIFADD